MKNKNKISTGILSSTLGIILAPNVITNNDITIEAFASQESELQEIVTISDTNLKNALYKILSKDDTDNITKADMLSLPTTLDLSGLKISNLEGLEHATQLENLNLKYNHINSISALSDLTNLKVLNLDCNFIDDISNLETLDKLEHLSLSCNKISDISKLSTLTTLTSLNLDSNELTDVSSLNTLVNLTNLSICGNKIDDISSLDTLANIESLNVSWNEISNIDSIANMTKLEYLDLGENNINDISILSSINTLKNLYINNNSIENIDALSHLALLTGLDISNNNISDITAFNNISGLTSLERLGLNNLGFNDLSKISNLTKLKVLNLSGNSISNIEPLKNLLDLNELNLDSNNLVDISTLSKLINLKELSLSNNNIEDISHISSLDELWYLNLSSNNIVNLNGLSDLSNIIILYLEENKINDISEISGYKSIEYLDISSNEISDLSNLDNLSNLTTLISLTICESNLKDLNFVSTLVNLKHLDVQYNQITDISSISNLVKLEDLHLDNNNISDIKSLNSLDTLEIISLSNNNITDVDTLSNLSNLKTILIDNNKIKNVKPLASLNKLEYVSLSGNQISDVYDLANLNLDENSLIVDNQRILINAKLSDRIEIVNPLKDFDGNVIEDFDIEALNGENVSTINEGKTILIENATEQSDRITLRFNREGSSGEIFEGEIVINLKDVQIELIAKTQGWTKEDVKVSYDVASTDMKITNIILPDGTKTTETSGEITVSSNGTYNLHVELEDGLIITESIVISNIDKTAPELEVSLLNLITAEVSYTVTATDKESGISKVVLPDGTEIFVEPGKDTITHSYLIDSPADYTFTAYDKAGNSETTTLQITEELPNPDYTAPTINASDKTIEAGSSFNPLTGVTAIDRDGTKIENINVLVDDVTPNINTPGKYVVVYEVEDKNGVKAQKTIYVTIIGSTETVYEPIINASDRTILVGSNFNPKDGVSAIDTEDNSSLTDDIEVIKDEVTPNINTPGDYEVTFKVKGKSGGITTKTITITVVAKSETLAPPTINASDRIIPFGSKFKPLDGVSAIDCKGNDITDDIDVTYNNVNEFLAGEYKVTYTVKDSNNLTTEKTIKVTVVTAQGEEIKPVINASDLTVEKGTKFEPLNGVTAHDGKGNNITKDVKVAFSSVNTSKVGKYTVIYEVSSNGVTVQKSVNISVINSYNIIPKIHGDDKSLIVGEKFDEREGITATDKEDGDLTSKIEVIENNVNTSKPGNYIVKYKVTDSDEATTILERNIRVYNADLKPILKKKTDIIIAMNQSYSIIDFLEATDKTDSDINNKIKILNHNIDIAKAGIYTVECEVINSLGLRTVETFEVIVKDMNNTNGNTNNNTNGGSNESSNESNTSKPQTGDNLLIYSAGALLSSSSIISINRKKKDN